MVFSFNEHGLILVGKYKPAVTGEKAKKNFFFLALIISGNCIYQRFAGARVSTELSRMADKQLSLQFAEWPGPGLITLAHIALPCKEASILESFS
jgi:hypothetical protein